MFKINIINKSDYQNDYINILLDLEDHEQEFIKDLCVDLKDLSFPVKSVHEIRFCIRIFEKMQMAIQCAFLNSCKTWLAIDNSSFLNIQVHNNEGVTFIIELLHVCGYRIENTIKISNEITAIIATNHKQSNDLEHYWKKMSLSIMDQVLTDNLITEWGILYNLYYNQWRGKTAAYPSIHNTSEMIELTSHIQNNKSMQSCRKSIISVYLWGGLGNQLYLYAFAKSLAEKWQAEVRIDTSCFDMKIKGMTPREYKLKHFSIDVSEIEKSDIREILLQDIVVGPWHDGYDYRKRPILQEQISRGFDPLVFSCRPNLYITGYWQSYKYFASIRSILLKEFAIMTAPNADTVKLSEVINATNSISIHIRRGDYLIPGQGYILSTSYYYRAIDRMAQAINKPHFYIFSDDPQWVRENIAIQYPMTIIDCNTEQNDYDDLRLMSLCRNHILANSSFSWWGAWLNNNDEKIVIAPSYGGHNSDMYPPDWQVI